MAESAIKYLLNEELWNPLSTLGHERTLNNSEYSWDNVAKKWEQLFYQLLDE